MGQKNFWRKFLLQICKKNLEEILGGELNLGGKICEKIFEKKFLFVRFFFWFLFLKFFAQKVIEEKIFFVWIFFFELFFWIFSLNVLFFIFFLLFFNFFFGGFFELFLFFWKNLDFAQKIIEENLYWLKFNWEI